YVSGPAASWSNQQRRRAVRRAASRHGMAVTVVPAVKPPSEAGREATAAILKAGASAAIAFDDLTAQGLLAGLAEHGIAVPAEFSVIGCDDVLGLTTYPPLTTVSSRGAEAGRIAIDLLTDVLAVKAMRDVRYVLDTQLVIRGTTARARPR